MGRKFCRPVSAGPPVVCSEVPGLRAQSASCCKVNCMAIQTMKPASSLRQCWKEQDGTCPARSNHFWCLLSSSGVDCPKLPPPIPFQGPEFQPEKYLRGRHRRKSTKMQNRGPEKTFLGRAKSSPKNGNFAPEARGQSCLTIHVTFCLYKTMTIVLLNVHLCTRLEDVSPPPI